MTIQAHLASDFHAIYNPIVGAGTDYQGHEPVETPESKISQALKLKEAYLELKEDMLEEVNTVDVRIIKPAMEGRESIQPMKKVIKKRQDRKVVTSSIKIAFLLIFLQLDFERYQGRYDAAHKKTKRSERENVALAKHESDFARAKQVSASRKRNPCEPRLNHLCTEDLICMPTTDSCACLLIN